MKRLNNYFTKAELTLWGTSSFLILVSFFAFDRVNDLYGFASWKRMEKRQLQTA